jgi:hypothetical protein
MNSSNIAAGSNMPQDGPPDEKLAQHHISKILDEVLEDSSSDESKPAKFKHHPMLIDLIMALGLLIAVGGFSVGLLRMYVTHSAEMSIAKGNYPVAIALIEGAPLPNLLAPPGSESKEVLNQALYLDAIQRLDKSSDDEDAVKELVKIEPGSHFFALAQTLIAEHSRPSSMTVSGQVSAEEHLSEKDQKTVKIKLPEQPRYENE